MKLNASCAVRCDVTTTDPTYVCVLRVSLLMLSYAGASPYGATLPSLDEMQGMDAGVGVRRVGAAPLRAEYRPKADEFTIPTWYCCRHYVSYRTVSSNRRVLTELETEMRAIVYYS